jgi:hypothetical protein
MKRDLANLVQALRMLMWRSSGRLHDAVGEKAWRLLADLDWQRPSSLLLVAERLQPSAPELAEEWASLADELVVVPRPRMPDDEELLRRYVRGEIGDRTVRWLKGWDAFQLIDECRKRGLPPCQVTETETAALSIFDRVLDVPPESGDEIQGGENE